MLEQAGHPQAGQGADLQHLGDGPVKIGAQGKADAAHAGVSLEVDVHGPTRPFGGSAQGPGLRQRVAGGGDVLLDEGGGVLRLHMAQNEDGQRQPGFAQASVRQLTASQAAPSSAKTREHWTAPWP